MKAACVNVNKPSIGVEKKILGSSSLVKRKQPLVLVKNKTVQKTATLKESSTNADNEANAASTSENGNTVGSLSMLAAYSNSSEESE